MFYLVDICKSGMRKVKIQPLKLEDLKLEEFDIMKHINILNYLTPFFQKHTIYEKKTKRSTINYKSSFIYF